MVSATAPAQDRPSPHISGRDVTFVASGDPSDPPRIVADFNGWDPARGVMTRDGRTGRYVLRVRLDPAARIEYLIAYRERFEVDRRNPLQVPSPTGAPRSELRMPDYRPPAPLPKPGVPGITQNVPFTSRAGESRRVRVHRPRDASGPMPILYVHDGIIAIEALDLPGMIDALGASGQMAPITAVFVNSIDRHEDFAVGSMFSYAFTGEIVPAIEQRYPLAAGSRSVLGFSRSTVGALDACFNSGTVFARCGLVAPAMAPPVLAALVKPGTRTTAAVTILAGAYDVPLIDDARALRKVLQDRGTAVQWLEAPEGHNHTAWKAQLPKLLTSWFPSPGAAGVHSARSAAIGSRLAARRAGR